VREITPRLIGHSAFSIRHPVAARLKINPFVRYRASVKEFSFPKAATLQRGADGAELVRYPNEHGNRMPNAECR